MWSKHRITFQDHIKYIHNDILKPFKVVILQYAERVREMRDLAMYLPPPSIKGDEYDQTYWTVHEKEFPEYEIVFATRDSHPTSMQDGMDDKDNYYC